jgi:uncharacterized protein (TIRG00374 family)
MLLYAKKWFGTGLGIIFLVISLYRVSWGDFYLALAQVRPEWIGATLTFLLLSMCLRAYRWFCITGLPKSALSGVWNASCVGYFGTAVFPARAGDVLRVLRLRIATGIDAGYAIGSAVIDRVSDAIALLVLLIVTGLVWGERIEISGALWILAIFFLTASVGGMLLVVRGNRLLALLESVLHRWNRGKRLSRWFEECLTGLQVLKSTRLVLWILLTQVLITMLDIVVFWALFFAFGWVLPFTAALVLLVYLAVAVSLPSTPGYVGIYQIACLLALPSFGISESAAVAYGTVLQVLTLLLFIGFGTWAYKRVPKI